MRVGTLLQFIGGRLTAVCVTALIVGLFFVIVGVTPWQYVAEVVQHPPALVGSVWFSPSVTVVGVALIGAGLWFNVWSTKQKVVDALAEEIAWAIRELVNRKPEPITAEQIDAFKADFEAWCGKVSKRLENRTFFTRADQLHFDYLGFVDPLLMSGRQPLDKLLGQLRMKVDRLRDVINWTQQRRR